MAECMLWFVRSRTRYTKLIEDGASTSQRQDFLAKGDSISIMLGVRQNFKDAAAKAAWLRDVSFSTFIRACIINQLTERS